MVWKARAAAGVKKVQAALALARGQGRQGAGKGRPRGAARLPSSAAGVARAGASRVPAPVARAARYADLVVIGQAEWADGYMLPPAKPGLGIEFGGGIEIINAALSQLDAGSWHSRSYAGEPAVERVS